MPADFNEQFSLSHSNSKAVIIVCLIIGPLAVLSVLARLLSRWRYVGLKLDDWFMFVSMIFFTVYCTATAIAAKNATVPRALNTSNFNLAVDMLNVAEMFYILTLMVLKISIALFYLQILQSKAQKRVIYVVVGCSTIFSIAMFFFVIFQCGYYNGADEYILKRLTHKCVSKTTTLGMSYTHGLITMLTDWALLIMPVWLLWGSNMTIRTKVTLGLLLSFASLSGIASIVRLPYIRTLALPELEFFPSARNLAVWSALEPGIGIIAGCLVVMRPLFRRESRKNKHTSRSYIDEEQATRTPRRRNLSDISITLTEPSVHNMEDSPEPRHPAFLQPPNEPDRFPRSSLVKKVFRSSRPDAREPSLPMYLFSAAARTPSRSDSRPGRSSRSRSRSRPRSKGLSISRSNTSWSMRSKRPGTGASANSKRPNTGLSFMSRRPTTMATECDTISEAPPVPKVYLPVTKLPKAVISANVATRNLFAKKRSSNSPSLPLHLFEGTSFD